MLALLGFLFLGAPARVKPKTAPALIPKQNPLRPQQTPPAIPSKMIQQKTRLIARCPIERQIAITAKQDFNRGIADRGLQINDALGSLVSAWPPLTIRPP